MKGGYFQSVPEKKLLINYIYYLTDFGLRIGLQIVYFIIISRALGAASYGIFASVSAIASFFSYFCGLGSEQTLVRRTSGQPHEFSTVFGHALVCLSLSVLPILLICTYAIKLLLHGQVSVETIIGIALAELFFGKLTGLASVAYMSQEMAQRQTVINIVTSGIKLAGATLAWHSTPSLSIEIWAIYYCASAALAAIFSITLITRDLGRTRYSFYSDEIWNSLQYALEMSTNAALRDFDKPLVVHVLGPEIGGLYAAASRVIETAAIPINAFLQTTYSRYFQHARTGFKNAVAFGLRVLPLGLVLSVGISLTLLATAWIVPLMLGPSYEGVAPLIRWLAVYPIVIAIFGTGSDLLRSYANLMPRLEVVIVSVMVYLPACYLGAMIAGGAGAAVARSCSQLLLATMVWRIILRSRREI